MAGGLAQDYAEMLTNLDLMIAAGKEEQMSDAIERIAGRKPTSLAGFMEKNRGVWMK